MNWFPHTWPDGAAAVGVVITLGGLICALARELKKWCKYELSQIMRELMPNGGSSLRDAVDGTDVKVERFGANVEKLTEQVASIDTALQERGQSISHIDEHVDGIDAQAAHTNKRLEEIEVKMDSQHQDTSKRLTALERRRGKTMPANVREALSEPQKQAETKSDLRRNLKGRKS